MQKNIENNQSKYEEQKTLKDINKISEIIKKEMNCSKINSEHIINYLNKNLFSSIKKNLNKNDIIISI